MTYAEIRRELLNSASETEYFRYGISKDTAAALLAADRSRMCALDAYNAHWVSVDEYYDGETRAQYSSTLTSTRNSLSCTASMRSKTA